MLAGHLVQKLYMFSRVGRRGCELVFVLFEEWVMIDRGESRTAATSKMEIFVILINGFQPLTIITKCSILDVTTVLDPPLMDVGKKTPCQSNSLLLPSSNISKLVACFILPLHLWKFVQIQQFFDFHMNLPMLRSWGDQALLGYVIYSLF